MLIGHQGHKHDFAHDRCDRRKNRGRYVVRKRGTSCLQALGNDLTSPIDINAPAELYRDNADPDSRDRSNSANARRTVHRRLNREGDETLDVLGRHTVRFGNNCDGRRRQVGKHVDRRVQRLPTTPNHQQHRCGEDQQPVAK